MVSQARGPARHDAVSDQPRAAGAGKRPWHRGDRPQRGERGLTQTGQSILPHLRGVFASLRIIRATASAGVSFRTGLLTVGSHGTSSSLNVLSPILERFKQRYPGIEVFVTEKLDVEIERDLVERWFEIGVVALASPTSTPRCSPLTNCLQSFRRPPPGAPRHGPSQGAGQLPVRDDARRLTTWNRAHVCAGRGQAAHRP